MGIAVISDGGWEYKSDAAAEALKRMIKGLVFIHPLALFLLYFLLGTPAALLTIPASANPEYFPNLIMGYAGLFLGLIFSFFWLYAVYKFLARKQNNVDVWDPNRFDRLALTLLLIVPAVVAMDVGLRDTPIYQDYNFVFELIGAVTIFSTFFVLGIILWSTKTLLNGGLGTFLALLYWPLFSAFIQNRIRELYPEESN